jgi:endo-1,4-beta-mannosidase
MWQLMNEAENQVADQHPECGSPATLKAWADDVSSVIKSLDSNHLISLGTIGGGQCGAVWNDYETLHSSQNIDLCEYHDYGAAAAPLPGDAWNGLEKRVAQCNTLQKPLFIGESGIRNTPLATRAAQLDAKFRAVFRPGVAGALVWAWNSRGSASQDFDVGPGDPVLGVLQRYMAIDVQAGYPPTTAFFTR